MNAINWVAELGLPHPNLADAKWQEVIDRWAEGADLILVDNVMSLFSVPGVSMGSDEFWKPAYDWSLRQRAAGRTVVFFDHTNSQGEVFGTKTKRWNADLCLTLETPKEHSPADGCLFHILFDKVRGVHGDLVKPFEAQLTTDSNGKAVWKYEELEEVQAAKALELEALGMAQRQIAEELGMSLGSVNRLLKRARKEAAK